MSNYFHPGVTRRMADQLADQCIGIAGCGESVRPENWASMAKQISDLAERALNRHACSAAGIMGNDSSKIESLVWYRGGEHPLTCRDQIDELKSDIQIKDALIDRAKPLLEEYFSELDCSGETGSRAANEIRKLLTDIEHL